MRVSKKRYGEVQIKKQGQGKNVFDKTRSFSIEQTSTNYSIEQYKEILEFVTDLTEKHSFQSLKKTLEKWKRLSKI
ncbi:unnamed protein product [marine sediment metagenome]|uniref:Uncharacterized protein n=1 Tax=marine sediment metagenome TaxID=412755 RepID=X1RS31_9ZZZZ